MSGNTKAVLQMVNGFFNIDPDFVCGIPFLCPADCSRVSTEVLFRININHSSTGRGCAWVAAEADTARFLGCAVSHPFHFGADEFHGWEPAAQMGPASLAFHWHGRNVWTAGDSFCIYGVINSFQFELIFQRNVRLFKGSLL